MESIQLNKILTVLIETRNILIIQDLDGVCIPLVKDPLERKLDKGYIEAVNKINKEFMVLTNGEHERRRGVNRLVENNYKDTNYPREKGFYLPGLAAGGVEYQNSFGNIQLPGGTKQEKDYLLALPEILHQKLIDKLSSIFINYSTSQ